MIFSAICLTNCLRQLHPPTELCFGHEGGAYSVSRHLAVLTDCTEIFPCATQNITLENSIFFQKPHINEIAWRNPFYLYLALLSEDPYC